MLGGGSPLPAVSGQVCMGSLKGVVKGAMVYKARRACEKHIQVQVAKIRQRFERYNWKKANERNGKLHTINNICVVVVVSAFHVLSFYPSSWKIHIVI